MLTITFPGGQAYTMQGDEINVGRSDVAQNWHPELDVIPYGGGAPDLGVSRHQARLIRQNGGFAVVDVGSTNGTYVNGRAVPYNQPTPLHDGDTLSFGALNTHVSIT
jgi:pSer/pThr/pTyr-binding forkhead associated (FHA) protein